MFEQGHENTRIQKKVKDMNNAAAIRLKERGIFQWGHLIKKGETWGEKGKGQSKGKRKNGGSCLPQGWRPRVKGKGGWRGRNCKNRRMVE